MSAPKKFVTCFFVEARLKNSFISEFSLRIPTCVIFSFCSKILLITQAWEYLLPSKVFKKSVCASICKTPKFLFFDFKALVTPEVMECSPPKTRGNLPLETAQSPIACSTPSTASLAELRERINSSKRKKSVSSMPSKRRPLSSTDISSRKRLERTIAAGPSLVPEPKEGVES